MITMLSATACWAAGAPTLEKLEDKDYEPGCGYYVTAGEDTVIATSVENRENYIVVKINGKLHKLSFKSSTKQTCDSDRLGATCSYFYEDKEVSLRLDHTVTHNCRGPRKDPDCEGITYNVNAHLNVGPKQNSIKKLTAYHGC